MHTLFLLLSLLLCSFFAHFLMVFFLPMHSLHSVLMLVTTLKTSSSHGLLLSFKTFPYIYTYTPVSVYKRQHVVFDFLCLYYSINTRLSRFRHYSVNVIFLFGKLPFTEIFECTMSYNTSFRVLPLKINSVTKILFWVWF